MNRSQFTMPRHVFGGFADHWTRTVCSQCGCDLVYQKGQPLLMQAGDRLLCTRCAGIVEDEPSFVLRRNGVITNDPCGVCGGRTDPTGYDVFVEWPGRNPELVCESCIERHVAPLQASRDRVWDDAAGSISAWEEIGTAPEIRLMPERRIERAGPPRDPDPDYDRQECRRRDLLERERDDFAAVEYRDDEF